MGVWSLFMEPFFTFPPLFLLPPSLLKKPFWDWIISHSRERKRSVQLLDKVQCHHSGKFYPPCDVTFAVWTSCHFCGSSKMMWKWLKKKLKWSEYLVTASEMWINNNRTESNLSFSLSPSFMQSRDRPVDLVSRSIFLCFLVSFYSFVIIFSFHTLSVLTKMYKFYYAFF